MWREWWIRQSSWTLLWVSRLVFITPCEESIVGSPFFKDEKIKGSKKICHLPRVCGSQVAEWGLSPDHLNHFLLEEDVKINAGTHCFSFYIQVYNSVFRLGFFFFFPHSLPFLKVLGFKKNPIKNCSVLCLVIQSCLTLCDPMDCSPPGSSIHGESPGKNTGVSCQALLQGIFPTQESNGASYITVRFFTSWATREEELFYIW